MQEVAAGASLWLAGLQIQFSIRLICQEITLINLFFLIGVFATFTLAALSLFIIISIFKAKRLPMDTSNRINHVRLVWFAISRPALFVDAMPWLKRDELDNLK